jgi:hypothetical protein
MHGWIRTLDEGDGADLKQKPALRRVVGANQHHAGIDSIVAGTKQEQKC